MGGHRGVHAEGSGGATLDTGDRAGDIPGVDQIDGVAGGLVQGRFHESKRRWRRLQVSNLQLIGADIHNSPRDSRVAVEITADTARDRNVVASIEGRRGWTAEAHVTTGPVRKQRVPIDVIAPVDAARC